MRKVFGDRRGYTLTITGAESVRKNLGIAAGMYKQGFFGALKEEGRELRDRAKSLAPYKEGSLMKSGKMVAGKDGEGYVVAVGFGDDTQGDLNHAPTRDYARYQHEMPFPHSKYLERPFTERSSGMAARISSKMRGV